MFSKSKPNEIKHWKCIYECNTDIEAQMVKNYLSNLRIPSNILSKRDSAYSLNIGEMALIYIYVPEEFEKKAIKAIARWKNENNDALDD